MILARLLRQKNRNGFTKLSFLRAYPYLLTQVIMCLCGYKKNIEQSYELRLFMNIEKFQMSFEQNIASNVTRNQEYKHITNLNIPKAPPSMPKHSKQLFGI